MEEIIKATIQTGFAVAVAAYLLVRLEVKLEDLTRAIQDLKLAVAKIEGRVV